MNARMRRAYRAVATAGSGLHSVLMNIRIARDQEDN